MPDMTREEQIKFVNDLAQNTINSITENINNGKIPEDWNGFELRWLFAEKANLVVWSDMKDKRTSRYRRYKNTVIVENL